MLLNEDQKTDKNTRLTYIKGIGEKRAALLEYVGVRTISDLAKRSPQHLSEKTGIPITLISEWIIKANKMKK
jgi:predicted RecB family nuclease